MTPAIFEEYVNKLPKANRPKVVIYKTDEVLSTK